MLRYYVDTTTYRKDGHKVTTRIACDDGAHAFEHYADTFALFDKGRTNDFGEQVLIQVSVFDEHAQVKTGTFVL